MYDPTKPRKAMDLRPFERVRREPADATATEAMRQLLAMQEQMRRPGAGTMGVPSGLMEPTMVEKGIRLGAEMLPPFSVPEVWRGLKQMVGGDVREGAGTIGTELLLAGATGGFGNKARKLKSVAELAEGGAKAAKAAKAAEEIRTARAVSRAQPLVGPYPQEMARIPASGLLQKAGEGAKKTDPMPPKKEILERLARVDAAMRHLQSNAGEPWVPNPRGILDRTGFDPNFRMAPNTNTMVQATGAVDPVLAEALNNPQLQRLLERQVDLGLRLGGEGFYNLKPLADAYDEIGGPVSFRDWVNASSAGSIQAPLPQEMTNASILLFAKQNGISYDEAVREMMRRYPVSQKPWFSGTHTKKFDEYLKTGSINPDGPASGARKVPYYSRQKMGESMTPDQLRGASNPMGAVVDTHESKAVLVPIGMERYIDNLTGQQYEQVADVYRVLAQRLGLPVETVQAGRWLGGGPLTGLKSPRGDYVQGFEDALYRSAQRTGKDLGPQALRRYRDDVLQGRDFILPYYGKN